jgi:Ca2+-binding RTX toxin-like protein
MPAPAFRGINSGRRRTALCEERSKSKVKASRHRQAKKNPKRKEFLMKTGSPKKTYSKRMIVLAALVMATALVLSTPMAEAKKKLHVVHCNQNACIGTNGNDQLIGTDLGQIIAGREGNDVYKGNGGGGDLLVDGSTTSNDTYVFKGPDLGNNFIQDCGGNSDTVDLSSTSFRLHENVTIIRKDDFGGGCSVMSADDLTLTSPDGTVEVVDQFGVGKVDKIKFADGTLTF